MIDLHGNLPVEIGEIQIRLGAENQSSMSSSIRYFWVNQSKTYHHERDLGCLWAPMLSKGGKKLHHWERMDQVSPGDMILTYAKGKLMAIVHNLHPSINHNRTWDSRFGVKRVGWPAEYFPFEEPLTRDVFVPSIVRHLPPKYSPMTGGVKGTEGYLFEVSKELFSAVMGIAEMNKKLNR